MGFARFSWESPQQPGDANPPPLYRFLRPTTKDAFLHIKLEGMGPKLLVSDVSTADQPVLRWRLVVRGNTAVEFGVVPLCLQVSWARSDNTGEDAAQQQQQPALLLVPGA